VAEIVVRSRLGPEVVLDCLADLADESLVALQPPEQAPGRGGLRGAVGSWRDWLGTVLPLLLVAGWLLLSGPGVRARATDPFRIPRDPLAAARTEHELERLRAAVEAHRFAEGRWPERLEALVERGYVPQAALTDDRGRPYYYAIRDDEFVLLAPER